MLEKLIHCPEVHLWPAVPLHSVLVEGSAGLEDRLVDPSTSSNTSNHGTVGRGDNLKMRVRKVHFKRRYKCEKGGKFISSTVFKVNTTFLEPEGSFTLVFLVSGLWAMTVA